MFRRIIGKFYKADATPQPLMPEGAREEVVYTDKKQFSCDGPSFSGHPRVYLTIPENQNQIYCPYCSRLFKLT